MRCCYSELGHFLALNVSSLMPWLYIHPRFSLLVSNEYEGALSQSHDRRLMRLTDTFLISEDAFLSLHASLTGSDNWIRCTLLPLIRSCSHTSGVSVSLSYQDKARVKVYSVRHYDSSNKSETFIHCSGCAVLAERQKHIPRPQLAGWGQRICTSRKRSTFNCLSMISDFLVHEGIVIMRLAPCIRHKPSA